MRSQGSTATVAAPELRPLPLHIGLHLLDDRPAFLADLEPVGGVSPLMSRSMANKASIFDRAQRYR